MGIEHRREERLLAVLSALVFILAFQTASCASLGGGRPEVVRAEDVLVNSLTTYDAAMTWHFANSTKETPAQYKVFEKIRTTFPPTWKTLDAAITAYKTAGSNPNLASALAALEALLTELNSVWVSPK